MVTLLRGRDTGPQLVHRPGGERHESPTSEWVPTTCKMCNNGCALLVHVEEGHVSNVIGNPDSPKNWGRMCAKGKSGILTHYNLNRVTTPLKRTNPEKGIGVDPSWQEISWEEAIDTVATKLLKIVDEDPRKVYLQTWGMYHSGEWLGALRGAIGTPYVQTGISGTCGKTVHTMQFITGGGYQQQPEYAHCNYLLNVGTQGGVATREGFNHQVADCATARERGMKMVVVDPIGNNAAAKANEWLPILPGTDAAFGLGMLNVLLNELKIYDVEYLKHNTNGSYLTEPNGKYLRDPATNKPLLYDLSDSEAKAYDDPSLKDPAIEGEFEVLGQKAKPAFELLKARAAEYPVERAEEITSIPAETIRRIAQEFGEAAQIGAMMEIDGQGIPYRPVCLDYMKGPQGHKHAWAHSWAISLVNLVLGAKGVVGSNHSVEGVITNYPDYTSPSEGQDGMVTYERAGSHTGAFPGRPATRPERCDIYELFPVAAHTRTLVPEVHKDSKKYGIDHQIEMVIHSPGNQIMGGWGDVSKVVDWYKSIELVVGFAIELNETHELDDIVLPMTTYLEEGSFISGHGDPAAGDEVGYHQVQQKVVDPPEGVRNPTEVVMEIYERAGILDEVYHAVNRSLGLKSPYLLESGKRYTQEEVLDLESKSRFGEEYGWDWFKEHGVMVWNRDIDERFPGRFIQARVPVYLEHFIERGEELDGVLGEMNLKWDLGDYDPLPHWNPCDAYTQLQAEEIDAIGVHYKLPYVYGGQGNANPWTDELCEKLPHSYGVMINANLAKEKGIEDGDAIWVESPVTKVKVVAKVTQMIHPKVLGIAGHAGHWAQGKAISRGKGVNFNGLLPYGEHTVDIISTAMDQCAPLKVYKA